MSHSRYLIVVAATLAAFTAAADGDWRKTQKTHFDDGGIFDQIYQPGRK